MRWLRPILYVLAFVAMLAFPYGPLFPWSPLKPGYAVKHLARADVYYPKGGELPLAYLEVDRFVSEAEAFHALRMPKRMTIVACKDWGDFERFMPQHRGRRVGAVTLATGTVIYVTPKLREKGLDAGEFLRHELSHAALHQNQTLINAFRIEKQEWFAEGIAVLFGKQRAYLSANEFVARSRVEELTPLFDGRPQKDMRFAYQAWRYFLDYLMQTRGRDAFLRLERGCMTSPAACRDEFAGVYGMPLEREVVHFQEAVRSGGMEPRD